MLKCVNKFHIEYLNSSAFSLTLPDFANFRQACYQVLTNFLNLQSYLTCFEKFESSWKNKAEHAVQSYAAGIGGLGAWSYFHQKDLIPGVGE